jgi:hypothetical protein
MGKRIPIDDLFREKLSGGEEQLNLGAWANMERMLDGKNPYAREEGKKRRFLPLFLAFTLLSGLLTAGYVALKKDGSRRAETAYAQPEPQALKQTGSAPVSEQTNPGASPSAVHPAETRTASAPAAQPVVASASRNKTQSAEAPVAQKRSVATDNPASVPSPRADQKARGGDDESITENSAPALAAATGKSTGKKNAGHEIPAPAAPTEAATAAGNTPAGPTTETLNRVDVRERTSTKRNGDVEVQFDTLGMTRIEKEIPAAAEEVRPALPPEVSNPRLVALTPEQELAMQSAAPAIKAERAPAPAAAAAPAAKAADTKSPSLSNAGHRKPDGEGFFDRLRNFAAVSAQRVSLLTNTLINMGYPMIPGISVGVNAALFNTANNFGGFHIGFTNLKPLGGTVSLMTELKYFIRNNSGYTVNDVSTLNRNFSEDHVTLANQNKTIYTYQTDSSVTTFNFRNFSTLELPVMTQFHLRSVHLYGGVNFAYSFPLAVKEIKRNYVVNREVILDNSEVFAPIAERGRLYSRDDFGSRFGIGYTVGGGYSFNPNLSVDVRLTQSVWTNAKTLGQREVTSGYFRIPSVQLSLAYRFKKWVPGNR